MNSSLKRWYDRYVYPIVAPPAIVVVMLIRKFFNWLANNLGGNHE